MKETDESSRLLSSGPRDPVVLSTSCRRDLQPEMFVDLSVAVASASARSSGTGGQGVAGPATWRSILCSRSSEPLCLMRRESDAALAVSGPHVASCAYRLVLAEFERW